MKLLLAILLLLAGCASTHPVADQPAPKALSLGEFAHADILNAASIAEANGFPARAAMWRAFDTQLTAAEVQVKACKDAIAAMSPKPLEADKGVFTLIELGAEKVGSGVPAAVRINCEPIPLPLNLLPVPRL